MLGVPFDHLDGAPKSFRFDGVTLGLSTPEQKCIGLPERKYINDSGKKASELGAFS
jgi:hypothetical protein